MHDTALKIGRAAIEIYANGNSPILEVGSLDVNGSLRQFAPDGTSYVGVDLVPGKSVDIVVEAGKALPFKDEAFDLILASSVFEHDPAFWQTFLELARLLRDGGHLYINAPSNGTVHRYPEDHWRFYPDSGRALEKWSSSQGLQMELIESFTASRENDIWNDFVAVFRKGNKDGKLHGRFLYSEFKGKNVWLRGAPELIEASSETQDMELFREEKRKVEEIESKITDVRAETHAANQKIRTLEESLRQTSGQLEDIRTERDTIALDADRKSAEASEEVIRLQTAIKDLQSENDTLGLELSEEKAEAALQRGKARAADSVSAQIKDRLMVAENRAEKAEASVKRRFDELASLTKYLSHAERERRRVAAQRQWLADVHVSIAAAPAWWSLLPRPLRARKQFRRLRRAGVFDAEGYLKLYPDVASAGVDPVQHFILHGMREGRTLTR
ncbi:MAG: methyltransferase domain-containing protein [Qipengyuania pacifica]